MIIKVFLADDHTLIREGLRSVLEAERDIKVVGTAENGRDAVCQARQLGPDIVIMDISMPELNGIEATAQLHEACPSARVIILSMHHTSEHIFHALKAGAYGYLLKESVGQEIVNAVRKVYSGHRYLSQRIEETVIDAYSQRNQSAPSIGPLDKLGPREREILQLVVEGKTSVEISKIIFISPKTVETYRSRLMKKLGIKDIPSLVKFAIQHGVTTLDS